MMIDDRLAPRELDRMNIADEIDYLLRLPETASVRLHKLSKLADFLRGKKL